MPQPPVDVYDTKDSVQLPAGFSLLRDVLEEKLKVGYMYSFVGLVKDFRRPCATRGSDYKCEITLFDRSTEDENDGVLLSMFGPEDSMPQVNAGDVVLALKVKVQRYRSNPLSLIVHYSTDLHVYTAAKIPQPPLSAQAALAKPRRRVSRDPTEKEHGYVSWLYHAANKESIPDEASFQHMSIQSVNVKQKFSLLKDVTAGGFYDLLLRVVREPCPFEDRITVCGTDYTENPAFFNYAREGLKDPYGYTTHDDSAVKWIAPHGQMTMQITCYEPHATFIREQVQSGQWIFLWNVQIKYGRSEANLEGFLRGEQGAYYSGNLKVDVLDFTNDGELDPRFKDAIRRWRDYEKSNKAQSKEKKAGTVSAAKRKADGEGNTKPNAKQRRKLRRLAAEQKAKEDELRAKEDKSTVRGDKSTIEDLFELNQHVASERHVEHVSLIPNILKPVTYDTKLDGLDAKLELPFVCAKYQTIVRVVDYRPNRLKDFACGRKQNVWDQLSDYSGGSTSESDGSEESDGESGRIWEWRFALQLEDASTKVNPPGRIWVVVDNADAQCLINMNASDLRKDPDNLHALREKMFTLWGDLEEHKSKKEARLEDLASRKPGDKPPLDDSDQEEESGKAFKVSNKPFTCCIQQYGVQVRERDPRKANAGEGKRWERVFSLFGTRICS